MAKKQAEMARSAGEQRRPAGREGQTILTGTAQDNVGRFFGAPRTSILADMRGGPEHDGLKRDGRAVRVEDNLPADDDNYSRFRTVKTLAHLFTGFKIRQRLFLNRNDRSGARVPSRPG
jgi:hypothetical protein